VGSSAHEEQPAEPAVETNSQPKPTVAA